MALDDRRTMFPGRISAPETRSKPSPLKLPLTAKPITASVHKASPWSDYMRIMIIDQAGPAVAAVSRNKKKKKVAIKELDDCNMEMLRDLKLASHDHIVLCYAAY